MHVAIRLALNTTRSDKEWFPDVSIDNKQQTKQSRRTTLKFGKGCLDHGTQKINNNKRERGPSGPEAHALATLT